MLTESLDHSTPRTYEEDEKPQYNFKMNYKLEVRKQHLLQKFLNDKKDNIKQSLVKLYKQLSNDEVINKRISRKNSTTKPFKCNFCPHNYSSKAALKQHVKQKHPEEHTPQTLPLDQQKIVEQIAQI